MTGSIAGFHGVRAFRHRNFRLFYGGQAVSLVGTWMQQVAQGWLVLQLTGDPFMLGVIATAQFGPVLILGLFGGVFADQLPKRKTLIATQISAMVLALALFGLTVTGTVQVWHVAVLAVLLGITNSFDMPTRQAFSVEMVGREDVANAVGLNSALFNASRILGPAAAGLTIGAFDISIAFLVNGLSYLAVIAAYLMMRDGEMRTVGKADRAGNVREVFGNLAEGLRYVRQTPLVLLGVTVVGLVATFGMNFSVLVPALADHVLHVGATGYGFLMAASGVGATVAALGVAFSRRVGPRPIVVGAVLLGLASIVLGWSTFYPLSLLAMVFAGAGGIAMAATANTTIQLAVPDELRGRIMSVYTTTFAGSVPFGGLLMGAVASRWSTPLALVVGGVVSTVIGVAAWFWLRGIQRRGGIPRAVRVPGAAPAGPSGQSVPGAASTGAGAEPSSLTSARPR